ncbi:hypothetical protein SLS59_009733 [Nothophoma quercina]|uniref:Uncharacterized protein n=1 Tax=Nothophoma quercina TaxID=749835 RepID=A0ABR3QK26_9PLEO
MIPLSTPFMMPSLSESHAEPELLWTLTFNFIDRYSGTYRSRVDLRAKIEMYLDSEYADDLGWFKKEEDMDVLMDLAITSGGVRIGK